MSEGAAIVLAFGIALAGYFLGCGLENLGSAIRDGLRGK